MPEIHRPKKALAFHVENLGGLNETDPPNQLDYSEAPKD
jgi:hypothetical protein